MYEQKTETKPNCRIITHEEREDEIVERIIRKIDDEILREWWGDDCEGVYPSENEWNAWVYYSDGRRQFETGGFSFYLERHRNITLKLLKRLTEHYNDVNARLEIIDREWRARMGYEQR